MTTQKFHDTMRRSVSVTSSCNATCHQTTKRATFKTRNLRSNCSRFVCYWLIGISSLLCDSNSSRNKNNNNSVVVHGYSRYPCTRAEQADFQFPDCFIPDLNPSLLLSEASFVLSHDAATGYIRPTSFSKSGLSWSYSKNQNHGIYEQLNNGARALDLRPYLLQNGTIVFHHGSIRIHVTMEQALQEAIQWCTENPTELVLIFASHFDYEPAKRCNDNSTTTTSSSSMNMVSALSSLYQKYEVPYYQCTSVAGLTVEETLALAELPHGGYLLALDNQDYWGSFCGKDNYLETQLVTCYPNASMSCQKSTVPLDLLQNYMLSSANNPATDDTYTLGPPADTYSHPFFQIQALWQVTTASAILGLSHGSFLLKDDTQSHLHETLVDMIWNGQFDKISLLTVDNVAHHGNALLSVLRTTCGQSKYDTCSNDDNWRMLDPPPMQYFHITKKEWFIGLGTLYFFVVLATIHKTKRPKLLFTCVSRIESWWKERKNQQQQEENLIVDPTQDRKEQLLPMGEMSEPN